MISAHVFVPALNDSLSALSSFVLSSFVLCQAGQAKIGLPLLLLELLFTTCTFCAKMYHQSTPNYSTQNITHYNKIIGQGKSHPNSSTQKVCEKCDKYVTRGTRHSCTEKLLQL